MKRLLLGAALLLVAGSAAAQNNAYWKVQDKMKKADNLLQANDEPGAFVLYNEADATLEAALANPKTTAFAKLYSLGGQLHQKMFSPELNRAAQQLPFDTLAFCTHLDKSVIYFTKSVEENNKPNKKGEVAPEQTIATMNKLYLTQMMDYYNYAGMFMNAMGNKAKSQEYFQKYLDFPKNPVFTQQECDSIYRVKAANYQQTRFNLAYLAYQQKDWQAVVRSCDEALKDTASLHDYYQMKLAALGEMKDTAAWVSTLAEAAQRTGATTFSQNLLYYYMQNHKTAEAEQLAQSMVTANPNNKNAWFMKGAIELNIKRQYDEAIASFEKALAIDPDFADALYNIGAAYINKAYELIQSGKFEYVGTGKRIAGKGEAGYAKAKAIYDKELAEVRAIYQGALGYLEHLRELMPDNPKRWASPLQQVYSNLGEKDKAKEMDALLEQANQAAN